MLESLSILGVKVNKITSKDILDKIEDFLVSNKQNYIVTLNSEIVLKAQKDEEYLHILNNADLSITDGIGLKFAGLASGNNLEKITGADLTEKILKIAENKKLKIAVLNWSRGLSKKEDIEKALTKKYPDLEFIVENIERMQDSLESFAERLQRNGSSKLLQKFKPAILFITLGAPDQEKFIYHNLSKIPSIKLALGVGGSFDFISGKIKRAPLIFQKLGIEWFWRLAMQPRRWRKIYKAVIIFPCEFIKWKFVNRFL